MVTTVRQLYGAPTGSADNVANLQFVKRGTITAIALSVALNSATDNDAVYAELSLFPTFQGNTNDPNGPLLTVFARTNFVTSGGMGLGETQTVSGIAIPVEPGMKAYLNVVITGTLTLYAVGQLYVTS